MQASLESDRIRILAEIAADIGYTQLSLSIKEALVESAAYEAEQALLLAAQGGGSTPAKALTLAAAEACSKAASIADAAGKYQKFGEFSVKSLELRRQVQGHAHPDTLTSMSTAAHALGKQGQYREAEAMLRQVNGKAVCSCELMACVCLELASSIKQHTRR